MINTLERQEHKMPAQSEHVGRQKHDVNPMKVKGLSNKILEKILESDVLLEEDLYHINLHMESTSLQSTEHRHKDLAKTQTNLFTPIIIGLLSISVALCAQDVRLLYASVMVVFLSCIFIVQKCRKIHNHRSTLGIVDKFLRSGEEIHNIINKCLKFIQEMEIAAMGYTRITGNMPFSRLERSKQKTARENMQLRQEVLRSSVTCIMKCREAASTVCEICQSPTGDGVKDFGVCICNIPLEDLGPCFDQNITAEDMAQATDNLCLDILRDLNRFLFQQRSEFLRCLALMTVSDNKCDGLSSVVHMIENLTDVHEKMAEAMKLSYDMHSNLRQDLKTTGKDIKLKKGVSTKDPLYVALHSTQVHLRAALNVAIKGEEHTALDRSWLKDDILPQIKIHIDACNQCMVDADAALNPTDLTDDQNVQKFSQVVSSPTSKGVGDVVVDDSLLRPEEDFSEDQIFEGVPEYIENEQQLSDDDDGGQVRKRRIEETEHVMKELKSVLHVKTSEKEREVRKSKLFPKYKPKAPAVSDYHERARESNSLDAENKNEQTATPGDDAISAVTARTPEPTHVKADVSTDAARIEQTYDCVTTNSNTSNAANIIKVPRRPVPPGRIRRKRSRGVEVSSASGDGFGKCDGVSSAVGEAEEGGAETVPLGFGFSSALARQAASIARSAQLGPLAASGLHVGVVGGEATFGDTDSE